MSAGREGVEAPAIPVSSSVCLPLRIPFSVVQAVFRGWCSGHTSDQGVVERYGEVWLVPFQAMRAHGMSSSVRESLTDMVVWDVPVEHVQGGPTVSDSA